MYAWRKVQYVASIDFLYKYVICVDVRYRLMTLYDFLRKRTPISAIHTILTIYQGVNLSCLWFIIFCYCCCSAVLCCHQGYSHKSSLPSIRRKLFNEFRNFAENNNNIHSRHACIHKTWLMYSMCTIGKMMTGNIRANISATSHKLPLFIYFSLNK